MKNIVPRDSKYIPLTQQKWCCVPTCIQIIMLRHNIPLLPTELLGYHLGLTVPTEELHYFWNARTGARPPSGYGTQIYEKKYDTNKVFKKLNIPLKMSWKLIDSFNDLESFKQYLSQVESLNRDILICYDWGKLFNKPDYQGGHVCVLDRVDIERGEIRMVDPDYFSPRWRVVKIDKLYESMKFHGNDKSAGFWEIEVRK